MGDVACARSRRRGVGVDCCCRGCPRRRVLLLPEGAAWEDLCSRGRDMPRLSIARAASRIALISTTLELFQAKCCVLQIFAARLLRRLSRGFAARAKERLFALNQYQRSSLPFLPNDLQLCSASLTARNELAASSRTSLRQFEGPQPQRMLVDLYAAPYRRGPHNHDSNSAALRPRAQDEATPLSHVRPPGGENVWWRSSGFTGQEQGQPEQLCSIKGGTNLEKGEAAGQGHATKERRAIEEGARSHETAHHAEKHSGVREARRLRPVGLRRSRALSARRATRSPSLRFECMKDAGLIPSVDGQLLTPSNTTGIIYATSLLILDAAIGEISKYGDPRSD